MPFGDWFEKDGAIDGIAPVMNMRCLASAGQGPCAYPQQSRLRNVVLANTIKSLKDQEKINAGQYGFR